MARSEIIVEAVLVVDGDIISRHTISDYLRHCGYKVVEAVSTDEAIVALTERGLSIHVILCDIAAIGSRSGSELAQWVRTHRPGLEVKIAGSVDVAAKSAAALCEVGPNLTRPYEPQAVIDYINQLRSTRDRAMPPQSSVTV